MANFKRPSVPAKSTSIGWLVCGGMLLGAVTMPLAVYGAVEVQASRT